MFSQSWASVLVLLGIAGVAVSQDLPTLIDALVANNASEFANLIQSDAGLRQLYLSGHVKTVFAPIDLVSHGGPKLKERATLDEIDAATYEAVDKEISVGTAAQSQPGESIETEKTSEGLGGQGQRIVVDTRPANITDIFRRGDSPSVVARHPHPSLLRIASGLGNITNVIKADIRFNGGLIHITDRYFTLPVSLSSTSKATGQTGTFADLAAKSNLTSKLDTTQSITAFLPSDAAFSSNNATGSSVDLISNHIVAGVKYLPDLKDGATLTTRQGGTLRISVRDGQFFVNGARITKANLILENGVAHVIDKVLVPQRSPPVVSGGGLTLSKTFSLGCAAAGGVALWMLV